MNKPYIERDKLVIPSDCEAKYRWWQGGQSPLKTVKELTEDREIWKKYSCKWLEYDEEFNLVG
jgi:hypothetical protein